MYDIFSREKNHIYILKIRVMNDKWVVVEIKVIK